MENKSKSRLEILSLKYGHKFSTDQQGEEIFNKPCTHILK